MCIQYVCPAHWAVLKKKGRPAAASLLGKIERIERNRVRMEAEVTRRVTRRMRTSPSSSPASSG
jgi:hypothetical protein